MGSPVGVGPVSVNYVLVQMFPYHLKSKCKAVRRIITNNTKKDIYSVTENITELGTLKRLLPICSSCHKIRNNEDYWEAVTDYLRKHTDLEFTHSICPDCRKKFYSDIDK